MAKNPIPDPNNVQGILKKARETFYKDPNVIGIGLGPKRINNVKRNEFALLIYVAQKLPEIDLDPGNIVPQKFMNLETDVIEPLSYGSLTTAVDYVINYHLSDDMSCIDWGRLRNLHMPLEYLLSTLTSARIQDFGDICVVEDDGTFVKINANGHPWVDYVEPYRLFRTLHGDDYDFVTFFADPQAGFPIGSTSFSVGVYNDIRGIGLGNYDNRYSVGVYIAKVATVSFYTLWTLFKLAICNASGVWTSMGLPR